MSENCLPANKHSKSLVHYLKHVVSTAVIIGETGSGKTTQIPQILIKSGLVKEHEKIIVSQPRRVAAMSIAARVAKEMKCQLGDEVGYSVRFEDCSSHKTRIKYVTDGCLLREFLGANLNDYGVIILDEAHERSLNTDILFGLVKEKFVLTSIEKKKRVGPLIIVMSATLDSDKFSDFFQTKSYHIPGVVFPIDHIYCDLITEKDFKSLTDVKYLSKAVSTVMNIHKHQKPGDILLFLTGQAEIEKACDQIFAASEKLDYKYDVDSKDIHGMAVLPLYASLPVEEQKLVFEKSNPSVRKIVVATNVAATSVTIDGIKYVVDSGFVKQNIFNATTNLQSLTVIPISKSEAKQRAGRAGRTCAGKCFRLYSKNVMEQIFPASTTPEIQRTNLTNVVLFLKCIGVQDVVNFHFIDPNKRMILEALKSLLVLGAIDPVTGNPTPEGKSMVDYPVIPEMSKAIAHSVRLKCLKELVTVIACLTVERIFNHVRKDKAAQVKERREKLFQSCKDRNAVIDEATCMLIIFEQYWNNEGQRKARQFCEEYGVNARSMVTAKNIRTQLLEIARKQNLEIQSCRNSDNEQDLILTETTSTLIRQCLCFGYFGKAACIVQNRTYFRSMEGFGNLIFVQPGSYFFSNEKLLNWIIYINMIFTSKPFMQTIVSIEYDWIKELLPIIHLYDIYSILSTGKVDDTKCKKSQSSGTAEESENSPAEAKQNGNKRKTTEKSIDLARIKYMKRRKQKEARS